MKTNIMFRILGVTLIPEEISKALGLHPTTAYAKGDAYNVPKAGVRQRSIGHWSLSTADVVASECIDEHAKHILAQIEPQSAMIARLLIDARYRVAISVWWEIEEDHGVLTLASDTLRRLSLLCHDVEIHFIGSSEGDRGQA